MSKEIKHEVEKVKRKLSRWAKNPQQINSQTLTCYLQLRTDHRYVDKEMLKSMCMENDLSAEQFDTNFAQMKNIAKKNYGEVFDAKSDCIEIWRPVAQAVRQYFTHCPSR